MVDSTVDNIDAETEKETLLEKIAKEMEEIAKGQDTEIGNEEDKKKIEDLEKELKESKKTNEQLQSIVRAQEILLTSKKEEIEGLKHLSTRKIQDEITREREMEEKDNHLKELKKQVEDIDKKRLDEIEKWETVKVLAKESSEELKDKVKIINQLKKDLEESKVDMGEEKQKLEEKLQFAHAEIERRQERIEKLIHEQDKSKIEMGNEKKRFEEELHLASVEIRKEQNRLEELTQGNEQGKNNNDALKKLEDELVAAKHKVHETSMNVNELVTELRTRGDELMQKDKEVYLLKEKSEEALTAMKILEDNLQHQR